MGTNAEAINDAAQQAAPYEEWTKGAIPSVADLRNDLHLLTAFPDVDRIMDQRRYRRVLRALGELERLRVEVADFRAQAGRQA
jgi:hypothetical protein